MSEWQKLRKAFTPGRPTKEDRFGCSLSILFMIAAIFIARTWG